MNPTIICSVRTGSDSRDTASSTVSAICHRSAVNLAREIESIPGAFHRAVEDGTLILTSPLNGRVVPGHGTLIVYQSGKKRFIREEN